MMIKLSDVLTLGATASIIKDPTKAAQDALAAATAGIGSIPDGLGAIGGAIGQVNAMAAQVKAHMESELQALKTKLPIMAAVGKLENAAAALAGNAIGSNPTALFSAATQGIKTLGPMMTNVAAGIGTQFSAVGTALDGVAGSSPQEKLAAFAASCPAMKIPDPANPTGPMIDNPAYAAFASANSDKLGALTAAAGPMANIADDAVSSLAAIKSAESAAVAAGTAKLKDYAFARFAAGAQPPAVHEVLGKFVEQPTADTYVETQIIRKTSSSQSEIVKDSGADKYVKLKTAPSHLDTTQNPTAPAAPEKKLTDQQIADYKAALKAASETLFTWRAALDVKVKTIGEWKSGRNYEAIKAAAQANPDDADKAAAYKALRDELAATPMYKDYDADAKLYNAARARQQADIERYHNACAGSYAAQALQVAQEQFGTTSLTVLKS